MATHSSVFAWSIPWTEEPGGATAHEVTQSRARLDPYLPGWPRTSFAGSLHSLSVFPPKAGMGRCRPPGLLTHSRQLAPRLGVGSDLAGDSRQPQLQRGPLALSQAEGGAKNLQLCPTPCHPMDCGPSNLPCPWDAPGKDTGVGGHALLQGNLPDPGIEPRDRTHVSCTGRLFTAGATWGSEALKMLSACLQGLGTAG